MRFLFGSGTSATSLYQAHNPSQDQQDIDPQPYPCNRRTSFHVVAYSSDVAAANLLTTSYEIAPKRCDKRRAATWGEPSDFLRAFCTLVSSNHTGCLPVLRPVNSYRGRLALGSDYLLLSEVGPPLRDKFILRGAIRILGDVTDAVFESTRAKSDGNT